MVLLRFAPSPTGALHLGGLRTALINHLFAKKHGGKWILRIEDTDATRMVPGSVDGIRSSLEWAGLNYDFGPGRGGPHGPYFQSERLDLYHTYARKLLDSGHAYRCFCSADRLAETREKLARTGSNSTYDKACLRLTDEEVARRVRAGEKSIIRFNDGNIPPRSTPPDLVFGHLRDAHASLPTDPVLLKSDLFPTYHLASVVDDHTMGITHVLRGEEWLLSLPLHLDLYAALNLQTPKFAHLPLLLNPDGSKMSKRNGDVSVQDFVKKGWEPEALLNWLALAGWGTQPHNHPHTRESHHDQPSSSSNHGKIPAAAPAPDSTTVMTLPELIQEFDVTAVTHRRTSLDPMKLEYLNKHHLMNIASTPEGLTSLAQRIKTPLEAAFPSSKYITTDYIMDVIRTLGGGRLVNRLEIVTTVPYLFTDSVNLTTAEAKAMVKSVPEETYHTVVRTVLDKLQTHWPANSNTQELANILHAENDKLGIKQRVFMTVLRQAISGVKAGPSVPEIMNLLGPKRTRARLEASIALSH